MYYKYEGQFFDHRSTVLGFGKPELKQMRVDHTVSRLNELVKELDSLTLTER